MIATIISGEGLTGCVPRRKLADERGGSATKGPAANAGHLIDFSLTSELRMKASLIGLAMLMVGQAHAEEIGCISTTFRFVGANDKVCVEAFDDPAIPGVSCHVSQARTGGIKGPLGLAEDPSRFGISCRQTGPIAVTEKISEEQEVFSANTSILFKETQVHRMYDRKRNALVYVAISTKIIEGSPMSAISTVPIVRWDGAAAP